MKRSILLILGLLFAANPARAITTDAMLDSLQYTGFLYFWNEANPANGMIKDRSSPTSPASTAAMGFGLSAIAIGADHGWVARPAAAERVRVTLQTLWTKPQSNAGTGTIGYKGLFYHFLDMNTGTRTWDSELSTIDTALLFAGIYDARQYFDGVDTTETRIRALADSITRRADWRFMRNGSPGLQMGYKPSGGFSTFGKWVGYNEAMIMYIIAIGQPVIANRDTASDWNVWTSGYNWNTTPYNAQPYLLFPPLFGHQYSHAWIDFRYIGDAYMRGKGITYFENSRRATLAQRAYAIANPLARAGYSDSLWGLTASDVPPPVNYNARGAPPSQNDDGTITPTAPLSSLPFTPNESLAVAWYLWNHYRPGPLWGPYGFRDAFNLSTTPAPWYDADYLGIDQGPIVLMIENYRTGRVWNRMLSNPDIHRGLELAGFLPVVAAVPPRQGTDVALAADPNPFVERTTLRFRLPERANVRLTIHDVQGRLVARLVDGVLDAGPHAVPLQAGRWPSGVYLYRLESAGRVWTQRCVLVR